MAIITSGWENSGGTDVTDGGIWSVAGTPTVVSSPVYAGNYAMSCTNNRYFVYYQGLSGTPTDCFCSIFLRVHTSALTNGTTIVILSDSSYATSVSITIDTNNNINLVAPSGTYSSGITLLADTYYCIQIERKTGSGNGVANLWINGVQKVNRTTETITGGVYEADIGFSDYTANHYGTMYFDSTVIDTSYVPYGAHIHSISDIVGSLDIVAITQRIKNRNYTENNGLLDSKTKYKNTTKPAFTDYIGNLDDLSKLKYIIHIITSELSSLYDDITHSKGGAKTLSETFSENNGYIETLSKYKTIQIVKSELVGLIDSLYYKSKVALHTLTDINSLYESISKFKIKILSFTDSIGSSESISKLKATLKELTELNGIIDSLNKVETKIITKIENLGSIDSLIKNTVKSKVNSELIGTIESMGLLKNLYRTITEYISELDINVKGKVKEIIESIGEIESLIRGLSAFRVIYKVKSAFKGEIDKVGNLDIISFIKVMNRTLIESIEALDILNKLHGELGKVITKFKSAYKSEEDKLGEYDSFNLLHMIGNIRFYVREIMDAIGESEEYNKVKTLNRLFSESIDNLDSMIKIKVINVIKNEIIDLADSFTIFKIRIKEYLESLGNLDEIIKNKNIFKEFTDNISKTSSYIKVKTLNRTFIDLVGNIETVLNIRKFYTHIKEIIEYMGMRGEHILREEEYVAFVRPALKPIRIIWNKVKILYGKIVDENGETS